MYGVVLWSDEATGKAVIWCEDHGDLAFVRETRPASDIHLGAGDLVEFDLTTERRYRYADNPILVQDHFSAGLAEALNDAQPRQPASVPRAPTAPDSAQIIPFDQLRSGGSKPEAATRKRG